MLLALDRLFAEFIEGVYVYIQLNQDFMKPESPKSREFLKARRPCSIKADLIQR
jgi:hypothetical protein